MKDVNNFMGDYTSWINSTPAGTASNWANGVLTNTGGAGSYMGNNWADQGLNPITFNAQTNPMDLARISPDIKNQWDSSYGAGWEATVNEAFDGKKSYNIPTPDEELFRPDLFPESGSTSGLSKEVIDQIMGLVMPGFETSLKDMPANIERYVQGAKDSAESEGKQVLDRNQNDVVAQMIQKGMIGSDVASDALGQSQAAVAKDVSDKAYDAEMKGAQLQMTIPQILTQVANLGKSSESYSKDEGVPYRDLLADFVSMMN
ncbi:MAG: hypothetical protein JEZ12_21600 [Desulfobacterium sp.]|nr:hypothetical protein [Desulfobacterium sp.]